MTPERERLTYRIERQRAIAMGVLEPLGGTFFLMIAIQYYQAGNLSQGLAATGGSIGLILGPPVVTWIQGAGWPVNRALAGFHAVMALVLLAAAWIPSLPVYVATGMLALTLVNASIPLTTEYYQQNYPAERRGARFSIASTIRLGVAALVTWAAGEWLTMNLGAFRLLLTGMAVAAGVSAFLFLDAPGDPLTVSKGRNPFRALRYLREDRTFRWLILVWMFMGFGNLMMTPLRIKYLIEPRFGFQYSEAMAAFLIGVVPAVVIFCLTSWWGRLFDRINFFVLRAILNVTFLLSNLFFFLVGSWWGFLVGMLFLGFSFSGGNVAWSLWVTKIARPELVADYMSVHTFTTGLRGIAAPMFAVLLVVHVPVYWLVALSSLLIFISILMLGPELTTWHKRRPGHPVTQGVSE
jgi:hypothetical protein